MIKSTFQALSGTGLWVLSANALAHSGDIGSGGFAGFESGVLHPYSGLDHMLLAVGLGLLFSRGIKRGGVLGGVGLIGMLIIGFIAGLVFDFSSSLVEWWITLSVILTGSLLFNSHRSASLLMIASFAIFHGIAHGMEIPTGATATGFMLGMVTGMGLLYFVGYGVGRILNEQLPKSLKRYHWFEKLLALMGLGALLLS